MLVLAVVAIVFFALPFAGLLWRAPWRDAWSIVRSSDVRDALRLSIVCSLWSTGLSVLFGVPLACLLARVHFFGRAAVRALCTLSMVLPPVVGGVALFFALGRRGLVGQWLDRWFDIRLPFTMAGVVIAQTFVAMPFLVTLPAIRPALIAGAVLAWARALGEFGATITFAGKFPGTTQTLPLVTYLKLESNPPEAIITSLAMMAVSFLVLVALRERWLGGITASPSA